MLFPPWINSWQTDYTNYDRFTSREWRKRRSSLKFPATRNQRTSNIEASAANLQTRACCIWTSFWRKMTRRHFQVGVITWRISNGCSKVWMQCWGLNKFAKYLLICSRWNWLNGKWTHLLVSNTLPQTYWQFIEVDNWAYRIPWHNVCQWTLPTPSRFSWSLPHGSSTVNFLQPAPMHPHIYSGGHICLWTRTWL